MSKRNFLSLDDRVKVIQLAENGKTGRKIASEMGVGKTQVQEIIKRKHEVLEEFNKNSNLDFKRLRRATVYDDINDLCLQWFTEATSRRIPVSGPLIKERALKFAKDFGLDSFKASNGWLDSFVKRNNIVFKTMSGERGSVDQQVTTDWKEKLPSLCEGFEPEDIFNMDETGLFYRDSAKSTFFTRGEDCSAGKRSKDRLTLALCASMTGEKVKPLLIGKSKKPRCFKRISGDNLPVIYRANKSSWMTTFLYDEWLHWFDRKMNGRKVLLFVDNAPTHAKIKLKNVTVKNFPANTTSVCQPMDQGIIQTLKLKYRKRQLQHVVDQIETQPQKSGNEILKEISILDAAYWISSGWENVDASTISKCFQKCGFIQSKNGPEEQDIIVDEEQQNLPFHLEAAAKEFFDLTFQQLLDIDQDFVTSDTEMHDWDASAQNLLKEVHNLDSDSEEEEQTEEVETLPCSMAECFEIVEKLKFFATFHGTPSLLGSSMAMLDTLSSIKMNKTTKQTKISDFFKK
jgi:predicted transcriptional regulator